MPSFIAYNVCNMTRLITTFPAIAALSLALGGCASPPAIAPVSDALGVPVQRDNGIEVAVRALPSRLDNISQPAHYEHVYLDSMSASASSLQTISLADAVKNDVLASSDLQVRPLPKIDPKTLKWAVFEFGSQRPSELQAVGGEDVESNNFSEVNFALNESEILNMDHLAALIAKARLVGGFFYVVGYTDETGSEQHNSELAKSRAQSVATALLAAGIHPTRIIASGAGVSRLYSELEPNRRASVSFRISE